MKVRKLSLEDREELEAYLEDIKAGKEVDWKEVFRRQEAGELTAEQVVDITFANVLSRVSRR